VLTFLYYWLDLNSPDGKPSHSKILATATQVVFLVAFVALAFRIPDVSSSFVWLTLVIGSLSFGLAGLKLILKLRPGIPAP
jgi:hypothetical protein